MKWFKHSANASRELPIREIIQKYGYHGIGVFWCIMEHVVLTDGTCTVAELQRMFASRKYGNDFVRSLIFDYGCFVVNTHAQVRLSDELPTVSTSNGAVNGTSNGAVNGTTNGTVNDVSNARTCNNKTRKDKEKEEDKETAAAVKKAAAANDPVGIKIEDEDRVAVAEAILREQGMERMCDIFKQLYSAKRLFPQWQNQVCIKSGFGILLDKYWTIAVDMLQSFIIVHGKWEEFITVSRLQAFAQKYMCEWQDTRLELNKALTEQSNKDKADDFMSTYFGRPLPDDAPPRPSHTADWDGGEWYEPRTLRGGKRNPNYNIYATS